MTNLINKLTKLICSSTPQYNYCPTWLSFPHSIPKTFTELTQSSSLRAEQRGSRNHAAFAYISGGRQSPCPDIQGKVPGQETGLASGHPITFMVGNTEINERLPYLT